MNTKKSLIWIKICVVFFLVVLNSCEKPKPSEPPVKFSIDGYINIPNAVFIEAYRVLGDSVPIIVPIANCNVDNGNFKLILPDTFVNNLTNVCVIFPVEMNYVVSCPDANLAFLSYMDLYKSYNAIPPNCIGQLLCGKSFEYRNTSTEYYFNGVEKYWYYVDRDVTVGGAYNEQRVIEGIPGTRIWAADLSLKKGWNEIYSEDIVDANRQAGGTYTWTNTITTKKHEKYKDLKWYLWGEEMP